jgi:hypothetical protein
LSLTRFEGCSPRQNSRIDALRRLRKAFGQRGVLSRFVFKLAFAFKPLGYWPFLFLVMSSAVETSLDPEYLMIRGSSIPLRSARNDKWDYTASSLKWRLPFRAFAYSSLLRIFSSSCMSVRRRFWNQASIRCRSFSTSSLI